MKIVNDKSYKKLVKNMGFLTIGNFASKMLNYLLVPLYTNVLSTEQYGIADLITTTIALLVPLFSIQISEAVMRFLLDKEDTERVMGSALRVLEIGLVLATICSPILLFFNSISKYYLLFMFLLYSDIIYTFVSQFIKGIEKVFIYSMAGVINTFVVAIANIILLVFCKWGIEGYLLSFVLGYFVAIVYMIATSRKYIKKGWSKSVDKTLIKKMIFYSIPLIPNAMCWWINCSSDKYFVNIFCGAAAVGIYAVAYKVPSLLSTVMSIFFGAWQISAVEDFGSETSRSFFSDIYRKTLLMNVFASSVLIGVSKYLGKILFADDFFVAWKYTILLVIAYFFSTMASFLGSIYTCGKQTKMLFVTSVISAGVNFVLNLILIPFVGLFGAALATIICYMVVFFIRYFDSKKILELNFKVSYLLISIFILVLLGVRNYMELPYAMVINILSYLSIGTVVFKEFGVYIWQFFKNRKLK